jgi:hypothetical protein
LEQRQAMREVALKGMKLRCGPNVGTGMETL